MGFKPCVPTAEQQSAMEVARVGFMAASPFYAHFFYSTMREVPTLDVPTAATDGRHLWYNPAYLAGLKPGERVFVLAHEVDHAVCRDPQRATSYLRDGNVRGAPFDAKLINHVADYVRNAGLLEQGVGLMNPSWLFADDVTGEDLVEDVYVRKYVKPPPPKQGGGQPGDPPGDQPDGSDQPGDQPKPSTFSQSPKAPRGVSRDKVADAAGGAMDQLVAPSIDPVTGKEDALDEGEFKEAIARAYAAAKAQGTVPGNLKRKIETILDHQVDWREHVRMLLTGHMGMRSETWNKPNRRRLALNPVVIMPGKRGFGAELVVVAVDTSGSIFGVPKVLEAFWAEIGGVLADVRPKRVLLVECDARVHRVTEANNLDELSVAAGRGVLGGGGTSFEPVFDHLAAEGLVPDTLIYLTDLLGTFPAHAPDYPTVWCSFEPGAAPFGDTVSLKV